ncbi:MAG: DUF4258 domain-containing protein [Snowella sp.]
MEVVLTVFAYELTEHCQKRLDEREMPLAWVEQVLFNPQRIEDHPIDPTLICFYGVIPEAGGRVLKIVYNFTTVPCRVLTVHFERRLRGKL